MCYRDSENTHYDENHTGILKKSKRHIIACLAAFLIAIVLGCSVLMAAEPNENTSRKEVEYFLKKSDEKHITQLEVYYMDLGIATRIAVTESSLRDNYYEYKVIARDPNIVEVAKSLREFKFEKIDWQVSDFRWGCVFYSGNEEVLRLFFPNGPMVAINGVGYKATPELIRALTQFLPVKAYKEMNEFIEEQERLFPSVSPKHKTAPDGKKESDKR